MALLDHNGESEFPMNKNQVFDAMCIAIPSIKGMKVENADKLQGRILVKAGVSLYSWGENIPIQLLEIGENKTRVQLTSSPKTGILFGGAFDLGKNRKNIENILGATSKILQRGFDTQTIQSVPQQQPISQNQSTTNYQTQTRIMETTQKPKKKMSLGKKILIGIGIFILIGIIGSQMDNTNKAEVDTVPSTTSNSNQQTTEPATENVANTQVDKEQEEEDAITQKLKAKAKRDWPNDYTTQEYWVNEQIEAYKYMKTIPEGSLKKKAQQDWPLDFTTQQYWYNEQMDAKERMK